MNIYIYIYIYIYNACDLDLNNEYHVATMKSLGSAVAKSSSSKSGHTFDNTWKLLGQTSSIRWVGPDQPWASCHTLWFCPWLPVNLVPTRNTTCLIHAHLFLNRLPHIRKCGLLCGEERPLQLRVGPKVPRVLVRVGHVQSVEQDVIDVLTLCHCLDNLQAEWIPLPLSWCTVCMGQTSQRPMRKHHLLLTTTTIATTTNYCY